MSTPTLTVEQEMAGWYFERGVTCVVAPCCGFTFDASHIDVLDGGYSCPACANESLPAAVDITEGDTA